MKREIKFRAKRLDNGEWIYGDLVHLLDDKVGIAFKPSDIGYIPVAKVAPDTVGQYTGLKDRNGNEIYEGDIIRFHFQHHTFPDSFDERHLIRYSESEMMWIYDNLSNPNTDIYNLAHTLAVLTQKGSRCWIEVIGNIHDNPELLEELEQ